VWAAAEVTVAKAVMPREAAAEETAARAEMEEMEEQLRERTLQRDRFQPGPFLVVVRGNPVTQEWEAKQEILDKAANRGTQRHRAA
jgi:hypothetical protein